jgi:hypothetical protein
MKTQMKRPGYYVEGEWFSDRFHQARARAAHLAAQYGRPIDLFRLEHEAPQPQLVLTVINKKQPIS